MELEEVKAEAKEYLKEVLSDARMLAARCEVAINELDKINDIELVGRYNVDIYMRLEDDLLHIELF